jgi:hypothetical protein
MCNRKLYRLFVSGEVNLELINLWLNSNDRYLSGKTNGWSVSRLLNYIEWRSRGVIMVWLSLMLIASMIFLSYEAEIFLGMYLCPTVVTGCFMGFMLGLLGSITAFRPNYNKLLIRDLEMLNWRINSCGTQPIDLLRECAVNYLVRIAREIIGSQAQARKFAKENDSKMCMVWFEIAEKTRDKQFKPAFVTFCQFGLVKKKWDPYFEKAAEIETSNSTV